MKEANSKSSVNPNDLDAIFRKNGINEDNSKEVRNKSKNTPGNLEVYANRRLFNLANQQNCGEFVMFYLKNSLIYKDGIRR